MCELMAMSFARPIHADFSIREFALRGEENADGWGLAWYPDQSAAVVKEPREWHVSAHSQFLETYHLQSRIYLAHVRHKTVGGKPTRADTHPFTRELAGREYCFAHNGTVRQIFDKPLHRYRPLGTTDSEHLFCWLLERIAEQGEHVKSPQIWPMIHSYLRTLNADAKLNCLLTDGELLFCYFDVNRHKGLTFRPVYLFDETRCFGDAMLEMDVQPDHLFNHGIVMASNPLSSNGWQSFKPGELIVCRNGKIVYSSEDGRMLGEESPSDRHQPRVAEKTESCRP